MKVSIYDVANLAGVSISTVSRVLNKSGYVSSKTEKKVYDAVEKLNFIPNVVAQNLANSETKLIGLYFPILFDTKGTTSSTYILEFIKGVNEVLIQKGYHLLLINEMIDNDQILNNQCRPQYYSFIKQKRIDGLILGSNPIQCSSFFELLDQKMPMVYIGEKVLNQIGLNVYAQYKQYSQDILNYLYSQNHKHITVLCTEKERMSSVIQEFKFGKKDEELKVEQYVSPINLDSYLALIEDIFNQEDKPTALLVEDISKVQQTINFLNNLNLKVPNDVSIITVEHKFQEGEQCLPAVTSAYVPSYQMAVKAATLLFEYLQGNQSFSKEIIVDTKIIERDSVQSMASLESKI